ncbi:MAG TPA: hypothetical protein VG324_19550, partial [Blastocatellia bacterium]|nr:hypothetical protein [Blastocatellia bacterium]
MKRTALFLASLGFLLTQLAWTQTAKPDFTGKWMVETLTVESGIAPPPPPGDGKQIIEVEHKEPSLKIGPSRYTTDGKESANAVGNAPSKSKVVWEGERLVIESQI